MLPNIDAASAANMSSATPAPAKRQETDQLVQEANRVLQKIAADQSPNTGAASTSIDRAADSRGVAADKTQQTQQTQQTQVPGKSGTRIYDKSTPRDQAEINFQMTREERDVFLNYTSGQEDASEMTEEEQNTLQKVSERIEKLIEEAETKDTERIEKLEKAIKEWYNRLSNGKHKAPGDLIRLISQAAMGVGDLSKIDL